MVGKLEERGHLKEVFVVERIILKLNLRKYDGRSWIRFV